MIQTLLEDSWRLTPARMAERLTNGRFQRYRHVRFLEKKLAQAIGRGGARLVISMPPRHGKSWLASLFTPAWFLSLWPDRDVILTSHDANLAAFWGRGVREFLREHEAMLGRRGRGEIHTAGVGGPIGGRGGHLLIVDDPLKNWKDAYSESTRQKQIDWFRSTLYTRAEPGASIIVIMTRWHEDDLAGYLEKEHGDRWEVLRVPAISDDGEALCKERFDLDVLEQIRANIGSRAWNALYQQKPDAEKGKLIKRECWRYYREAPATFDEVVQSWDLAFKNTDSSDYVVGQVWGRVGANKYLIDQVRAKMDFPATLRAVRMLGEKYPQTARTLIEDKANGSAVLASLQSEIPGLIGIQPEAGKIGRAHAVLAEIEAGNVFLPDPGLAPWVSEFVNECSDFPKTKNDDQVDAMVYALKHFREGELNARTQCAGSPYLSDLEYSRGGAAGALGFGNPATAD